MIKPKVFAHCSYVGTGGYNNHSQNFFRELSKLLDLKIRNFTIGKSWDGYNDEPHNGEDYIDDLDKKLLIEQSLWDADKKLSHYPIYSNYPNNFEHNINIILNETNHHFFYGDYKGPKIAYNVWESTEQPEGFFNLLKSYNQIWVASQWQKDCTVQQGIEEEKVKVVPEAVDGEIFKPSNQSELLGEYKDNRFKFVLFGRWDYRKSTKEIIESFLKTFSPDEPVDLIVSIDNSFAKDNFNSTEERLEHYNLLDPRIKIKHFPTREEYIKYLQTGHVFLSCARSEGWNLPLIEAMACGTPSIYSDCSAQLEFAKGLGHPVKIKNLIPAKMGEYSSFSQEMLAGNFYEPDFEDLQKVMRDVYSNYKEYKTKALKESEVIRDKFTWENAAKIAYKELNDLLENLPENKIEISFDLGPKVEILGSQNQKYFIEFIDSNTQEVIFSDTISNNMWTKCERTYYTPWIIKINGEIVHNFNLKNKTVKISLESKSVGDTLAWAPQVIEFQKQYKCKVVVSTFHNEWFEGLESYKDIKFVKPGESVECYAHYKIGWFKNNEGKWDKFNHHPIQPNTIPLIQAATDILGLPYKEVNHGINFVPKERPIKGKYICIGPRSTSGLKEWPYESWRELAKKLHKKGYKIVNLSYEGFTGPHIINKEKMGWDKTFNYLSHADLFIGLGSGLAWANWALDKHTLMINNFIPYGYEFTNNLTKVENLSVCNGCWVNANYIFDAGDWDWCPVHQNTPSQHICQKSITVNQVYQNILNILEPKKFVWITGGDETYKGMIEVLAKSLLKYSQHKIIVYGFNKNLDIKLPNVINKQIDFPRKETKIVTNEPDLINRDYSLYFGKYLASLDSLNEDFDCFAWLDGDAFVTENIDKSLKYLNNIEDYPLFMRYYHEDINQWRTINNVRLEGNYGGELSGIKQINRNPNKRIIATGFYFYDKNSKSFFEKCLEWNQELNSLNIKLYADDNAFSEERVANNILWQENKTNYLPVTWNNFYSSKEETKVSSTFLKNGFDVMYDEHTLEPYFIHGPDPSVTPKNKQILEKAYQEYNCNKLMLVAHPDDEIIFGGAELITHGSDYKVVCLTNKSNKTRYSEFKKVMEELNVGSWEIWDLEDDLYGFIDLEKEDLNTLINSKNWEKIVTHNPVGEYGHPQHKIIFDYVKDLTNNFYVFGKSTKKLNKNILSKKLEILKLYSSEKEIINQLLTKNGDWFKSNNDDTNYIENESIEKYDPQKDITPFIACYEK